MSEAATVFWTAARVELLKDLWAAGASPEVMCRALDGATRGTIHGKIHRLGLPLRTFSKPRKPRPPQSAQKGNVRAAPKPKPPRVPPPPPPERPEPIGPRNDFPHAGGCLFIYGDVQTTWQCCGADVENPARSRYCAFHESVCYAVPKERWNV